MNHRLLRCLVVPLLAIGFTGCGDQQLPETPPGASRAMIENPLGKATDAKQSKVGVKAKAANEKAAGSDPRGK